MFLQQGGTHALALGVCNMPWGSLLYPKKMWDIEIVSVAPRCWGTVALAMSVAFGIQMGSASCIKLHKASQLWFFDVFFCRDNSDSLVGEPHLSHFYVEWSLRRWPIPSCSSVELPGESGVCGVCKEMGSAGNICQVQLTTKTIMWPSSVPFLCAWASSMISAHSTGQTAACACIHVGMFLESWPSELRTPHFWSRMGHSAGTSNVLGEVHYAARFFLTSSFLYTQIWRNVTIWHRF